SLALADRINVLKKNTEQAKAETDDTNKKLEEQQQQLAQNEKKYRTIFEDSKDIIFLTSLDGQIEDINPACEALLGYSRNEILHQSVLQLYSNPADRDHLSKLMLKNGSVKDLAIKLRRKDGRDIDSMATATLRHDENGVVTGFQGVIRDVTALKEAEAERLRALEFQSEKELAETANQAKSVFLANMSHELRTPLNAILGFSELMTRDQNLTLDQQRDLGTIGRSGEHLLALINDVLEFSKIEAGNVELRLENFDIQRMLVSLEDMFRIRAESKELALEIICEADVPRLIRADQNKMRQVLINLLGNAVEYTQKGGISLRVQIGKNQTEDLAPSADSHLRVPLRFEVEDSGKGIAEDDLESIFKAFFQSDNESQSSHGTGLGLPISQEFVRMMGGELAVSSKVGSGSKFYFELMVEQVEDSESVVEKPSQRVTGLSPGQQDFRILVAEDNAISRELMVKLLRQVGFDTREVTNGKEAVVEFEQWRPHLIWMDIRMPVMDGYEATRRIKNMPAGAETIIIALTASAFEEDRLEALEQGCDGFVRKPFRENEIFELMRKFLNVNFRYEKTPHKTSMANKAKRVKLTPELLVELSDELRLELKKAVDAVAFEETMAVIDKIPAQDETVADALTDLANQYRFDRLQELLSDSTQAVANAGGRAC
ncbi:MAG: ATP-binding protein, partial [Desulfuromonadales bacterium]|nr:ATP-binding protein [Desulfuromonadales bacterium]